MRADLLRLILTAGLTAALVVASVIVWTTDSPDGGTTSTGQTVEGRNLFMTKGCSGCHTIEGINQAGMQAPNLTRLAHRAPTRVEGLNAEEYVRQSLLEPQAFIAPGFENAFAEMPTIPLTDAEVDTLVDFLLVDR